MTDLRVAALLSLMASATACASGPQIGEEVPQFTCGTEDTGWILSGAPEDADKYRRLAADTPPYGTNKISQREWGSYERETWMVNSSGEVVLCLSDGAPWDAWGTTFWQFGAPDEETGQLTVADQGATIVIG